MVDPQRTADAARVPTSRAVSRLERAIAALLVAGLTSEQISRLADLRVRAQRGAYDDDGYGTTAGSNQADRRHEFARWLVQTGRLSDER